VTFVYCFQARRRRNAHDWGSVVALEYGIHIYASKPLATQKVIIWDPKELRAAVRRDSRLGHDLTSIQNGQRF